MYSFARNTATVVAVRMCGHATLCLSANVPTASRGLDAWLEAGRRSAASR
jgi:hypothetical protein